MKTEEFVRQVDLIRTRLYRTALTYMSSETLAMDVLDEAVYRALLNLRKLKEPDYFNTWITRILINVCKDELRKQKRILTVENVPEISYEEYDSLPLQEAIDKLPESLRDIIVLRYLSGYTVVETAEILELPQGTVATRQKKALSLLRLELGEEV